MITTGSKYLYGSAALALVGAFFLALTTAGHKIGMSTLTGAISFGYKGGVGDHFGYTLLVGYAGTALFVGAVLSAVRDGDPESGAQLLGLEAPVPIAAPQGSNHWPIVAAFGAGVFILGAVFNSWLFIFGLGIMGISALEWAIHAWTDKASGDPLVNRKARNRVLNPIEIPLMAIVGIALFTISLSHFLLAYDKLAGLIIFGAVPTIAFIVAIVINTRPKASKSVASGLALFGAFLILAGGVVGLAQGPRDIHHEEPSEHLYNVQGPTADAPDAGVTTKGNR